MAEPREPFDAERFIPGRVIAGRYRVVERVGLGGMGEVYRAADLKLGQPVALKFLPSELTDDPERLQALFAEVRLARQVSHPNVCRVHDIEDMDGLHFLSMEFVDGEDLASLLRRIGRVPSDKAVEIAREICAGLAAIHERGLLHRDLKPANVMVDGRGNARITDFGLAALQESETDPELIVGTPAYMAPECLVGGQPPSVQSDLYGLGLVLYEVFTGHRALEGATLHEIIRHRRETTPVPPSQHQRDIDPAVERAILACLARDPEKRPRSALVLAAGFPRSDPLGAAILAGRTPSPELVAAPTARHEGLRLAAAWPMLGLLVAGLALVTVLSPMTRLVPMLPLPEPPDAMAGRAREMLRGLGFRPGLGDAAQGFEYHESVVDRVIAIDRSPARWRSLAAARPPVVSFWYREGPGELVASPPWYRVGYDDPPWAGAMLGAKLDASGRAQRIDAPAGLNAVAAPPAPLDVDALSRAAGLDLAGFRTIEPAGPPIGAGDERRAWIGQDRPRHWLEAEIVSLEGRPVAFEVRVPRGQTELPMLGATGRVTSVILHIVRPALFLIALFVGAWLARRNLRAGRGDTKRAVRVAAAMMALRVLVWLLGGHHTPTSITQQLMTTLAWGLYDFAYGWVFYVAMEPYVRRLWPRILTSWVRLVDGQVGDPRLGRDLLVGCIVGTAVALGVAGHQAAPVLFGEPPGRPDNVGYVENQLASLLGLRQQLAELLSLLRSNVMLLMAFVVLFVMARLTLRNARVAVAAVFLVFLPLALPKGELLGLDIAFSVLVGVLLLFVVMRYGLVAAGVALVTHATLESAPLGMGLGSWPTNRTVLVLALVLGVGVYGFVRSLGGRSGIREVLAEE